MPTDQIANESGTGRDEDPITLDPIDFTEVSKAISAAIAEPEFRVSFK